MNFGVGVTVSGSVSVQAPAVGTPTGTMTFWANPGNVNLGTGTLVGGSTSITVSMQLAPGSYNVFSVYNGDGNDNTSTSPNTPLQVNKNGTNGTLTTTPVGNAALNQLVTLTATYIPQNGGQGVATGLVSFTDTTGAPIALGTATLNAQGIATLNTTAIQPGVRTLTATWLGDVNYNPPAVPPTATLNVSTGTTVVTLTPSPVAVPLGTGPNSTVTYSMTVSGGPANTPPSGNMTIQDGGVNVTNGLGSSGTCGLGVVLTPGSGNTSSGSCTMIYDGTTPRPHFRRPPDDGDLRPDRRKYRHRVGPPPRASRR